MIEIPNKKQYQGKRDLCCFLIVGSQKGIKKIKCLIQLMTERFKLAYIGAGSFRFSIGFFRNIVNAVDLMPMEVALCDINENSLEIMYNILRRMVKKGAKKKNYNPADILVTKSKDRRKVLEGADFVYKSISVGLQKAEWYDNYLPLKFGIPQNTGDTLGPGGLFRSLRTNHVAAAIAKDMEDLCPKATILNYTNPQGSIVMSARTKAPNTQYIGLCHEYFGGGATIWGTILLGKPKFIIGKLSRPDKWWEKIDFEYAGINHFAWFTKIEYKGKDYYPWLRERAAKYTCKKKFGHGFNFYLMDKHGYFPYPGSRHVAEFMTDYYNYFNYKIQAPYWKFPVVRDVGSLDRRRHKKYEKFMKMAKGENKVPKPRVMGERAMEMTIDWRDSNPNHHVVNIPNTHPDYETLTAYDGTTALERMHDDVDAVLLDRHMPDINGDRVLERIRSVVERRGRRFGVGPEGFGWLAE